MKYTEMSKTLLQSENPQELQRLMNEGKLDEVMQEIQEVFSDQEHDLIRSMHKEIEKENLPAQEELGRKRMAEMCAHEVTASDLAEFWRSID